MAQEAALVHPEAVIRSALDKYLRVNYLSPRFQINDVVGVGEQGRETLIIAPIRSLARTIKTPGCPGVFIFFCRAEFCWNVRNWHLADMRHWRRTFRKFAWARPHVTQGGHRANGFLRSCHRRVIGAICKGPELMLGALLVLIEQKFTSVPSQTGNSHRL